MKTLYFTAISALICMSLHANSQNEFYNKMLEINAQWKYYAEYCPSESPLFASDNDAIQAHLNLVCDALVQKTSNLLNSEQRANRLHLIMELKDYANKKVFPTNLYHKLRTPYFVDDFGVHCAVGYLMHRSGYDNLVAQISKNENYSFIEDIKTPGVSSWADKHGFTVDELKWIQPAYSPPAQNLSTVGNGTNGHIVQMRQNTWSGGLIIAGDFDTLDWIPCLNIGLYRNNEFSCFGNGLKGEIKNVRMRMGNIVVFGALEHDNIIYPMAEWNNESWEFIEIPGRVGAKATAGFTSQSYHLAIAHPEDANKQEIWSRASVNAPWVKELEINGFLTTIESSSVGQIFAGAFNEAYTLDVNGEHVDTLASNNVIFRKQHNNPYWEPIHSDAICDTVKCAFVVQEQIYFGGTAVKNASNSSGIVLSRFLNNSLQPILLASNFSNDTVSINAITLSTTASNLILGGDFIYSPMVGIFGRNLANYDVIFHQINMLALLDEPVKTISQMGQGTIFIGGEFKQNLNFQQVNHLARFGSHLSIAAQEKPSIKAYPNPFTDKITLEGLPSICPYKIVDIQGRTIQSGKVKNNEAINLENLVSGTYLLQIAHGDGIISKPIVKQ